MSKYFITQTTNATAAATTNVYQNVGSNNNSTTSSSTGATTQATSSAMRKLFPENEVASPKTHNIQTARGSNTKTTRIFMTTSQHQQLQQQATSTNMATHLLDHGYGVTTITRPTIATSVVVGQQTAPPVLSTTATTIAAPPVTSNTTPASQQPQNPQKFKPTDMTSYYKVSSKNPQQLLAFGKLSV